ncbi:MAG: cyclic nucleotide-binding domain-containing protein [Deltaproteobacteria bacterium]|nr:cyclic nucleotide-binding domain-containing protein [Deltaproteobacteria bacterium]
MASPLLPTSLRPWQSRAALRMALFHAAFVGAVTLIKSGTNAVFLAREDPHNLPWLYVAVAVMVWVTTSSLVKGLNVSTPARLLNMSAVFFAAAFSLLVGLCIYDVTGANFALYVLGEVYATVLSILFWSRLSDAFGPRDQKKVVGLISAGGMVGSILGGMAIYLLAPITGIFFPLALSAVGVALSLPLLRRVRSGKKKRSTSVRKTDAPQSATGYLVKNPYARWVALLVVSLSAAGAVTDFVFRVEVASTRTEAELASLFGILNATVGVLTSLFQLFLTERLLARVGLFAFGAIVPVFLLVGATAALLLPAELVSFYFLLLLLLKGTEMAGAFSLNSTMVTLLYNPMPSALRSQMRALIDGGIKKGGAALAGLVLGAVAHFSPHLLSPIAIVVPALLCMLILPRVRTRYLASLDDKLGLRKKRQLHSSINVADRVTRELLLEALNDPDNDRVVHVIDVLGVNGALDDGTLVQLLHHGHEQVREHALRFFPKVPDEALKDELVGVLLHDPSRRPRAASVRALRHVAPQGMMLVLETLLEHEQEPAVIAAALEVMLSVRPDHQIARDRLDNLVDELARLPAAWKREVARALGALDESRYDFALAQLLKDDEVSVRKVAIQAAGREHHEAHLPFLVELLADKPLRLEARQALVKYGANAVALLAEFLDDKSLPLAFRIHIPRVMRDIGSHVAVAALLNSNPRDHAALELRIAEMIVEIIRQEPDIHVDKARTRQAIFSRLDLFVAYRDAAQDLKSAEYVEYKLLLRTLSERQDQNLRIGLSLLGIHHGIDRTMSVYRAVRGRDSHAREDALELLDAELMGDAIRSRLLDVLEGAPPLRKVDTSGRLELLRRSPDPLLRALATHAATRTGKVLSEISGLRPLAPGAVEGEDMEKSQVERLFVLEHVDLFEGLSVDELTAIASIAEDMEAGPNEVLYREGDVGDALFVVVHGSIDLHKSNALLMTLVEGESLGQTSFLDRGPRPVTATVGIEGATFMRISRADLMDLMADRPGLMRAFFEVIGSRLRALLEKKPGNL